mmetsp:Transcript_19857/g.39746  ORF Transcript_19857/g.39746 Transcript_19857/m.39746 type:complete len:394 (+) Transcript_19857:212-1393(+)|eukprot:CAMPEP_0182464558 /NCGR_PEP_ID=MMETSP1319-20130603/8710_1 /TAXON_ID=172717 /ORGANISM="Bolidomonas pacifica, Strain RCC208" /LENGTH=393 /DNA_ID=CAMNT_0024664209 /DNA_START=212 /DNA_END=1393 /DNA_ORIENTATION=+
MRAVIILIILCSWLGDASLSGPSMRVAGRVSYRVHFENGLVSSLKNKLRRGKTAVDEDGDGDDEELDNGNGYGADDNNGGATTAKLHPLVDSATLVLTRLVTGAKSKFVQTSVAPIHVLDIQGSGDLPPIVLLHGITSCATDFAPLANDLRGKYSRILAIDLLGHGLTPLPPSQGLPKFNWMTTAVGEVLDDLLPGKKATLLGNSMGGLVAMRTALERPDKVNGLFLISPAGGPLDKREIKKLSGIFRIKTHSEGKDFIKRMHGQEPNAGLLNVMAWVARGRVARNEVKQIFASIRPENFMTAQECGKINVPCALFWGGDERVLPDNHLSFFRQNLPGVSVCNPPEFGHVPQNDDWRFVSQRCAEFSSALRGVDVVGSWLNPGLSKESAPNMP